jgi:hypothetical protein
MSVFASDSLSNSPSDFMQIGWSYNFLSDMKNKRLHTHPILHPILHLILSLIVCHTLGTSYNMFPKKSII